MQPSEIISVNLWQILISLANLVIMFLVVKHFLYKPVKNMLNKRQAEIEGDYSDAKEAKEQALLDKAQYEEKLKNAKKEADQVIKTAVDTAKERENEILIGAKEKASSIIRKAQSDALLEVQKAEHGIKKEIVDVSTLLTEKMLEREINTQDHSKLIDSFIEGIGEEDDAN